MTNEQERAEDLVGAYGGGTDEPVQLELSEPSGTRRTVPTGDPHILSAELRRWLREWGFAR